MTSLLLIQPSTPQMAKVSVQCHIIDCEFDLLQKQLEVVHDVIDVVSGFAIFVQFCESLETPCRRCVVTRLAWVQDVIYVYC